MIRRNLKMNRPPRSVESKRVARSIGIAAVRFACRTLAALWLTSMAANAANGSTEGANSDSVRSAFESATETFDEAQRALASDPQRARQLFQSAAQQFESVQAARIESGPLEYNLGNCYLQAGDTGRAILHYRRAERLMPNDPKLKANLAEARRRCLTSIPPSREKRILHDVFFWHHLTTTGQRLRVMLLFNAVFWLALTTRFLRSRRWLTGTVVVSALVTLACGASLAVSDWQERNSPAAVGLAMDVTVQKGPGSGYQRQFEQPLQPGTEFTRVGHRGGWWEIELPDGKTGWIDGATAELVVGNKS